MRSHPGGQGWTLPWLRPDSGGYRDFDQRRLDDLALDVVCFWAWIKRRLTRNGDDAGFASHPTPKNSSRFSCLYGTSTRPYIESRLPQLGSTSACCFSRHITASS